MQVSVLSGPSGCGKTSWVEAICARFPDAHLSDAKSAVKTVTTLHEQGVKFVILDDATAEDVTAVKALDLPDMRVLLVTQQ